MNGINSAYSLSVINPLLTVLVMEGVTVEDVKWTPEMEVVLFKAMQDHKPVGMAT